LMTMLLLSQYAIADPSIGMPSICNLYLNPSINPWQFGLQSIQIQKLTSPQYFDVYRI
jgi:hypothetical protein